MPFTGSALHKLFFLATHFSRRSRPPLVATLSTNLRHSFPKFPNVPTKTLSVFDGGKGDKATTTHSRSATTIRRPSRAPILHQLYITFTHSLFLCMFKIIKILISSFPFLLFTETISFGFSFTVLQVHSKKSLCIFIKTKTQHTPQQKKTKKVLINK